MSAGSGRRRTIADMPERVRHALREQEEEAEILIGWVQLALVAVFGLLYAVSPRPADAMTLTPVPVALAAYAAFTLARLALAYRRRLRTWVLGLSIALDMALLMGLIWSFHIEYGQPPSFYLKAPTLLYVFIFIALRALRFDPRFVLAAGLAAAAGWAALLGYAIMYSGPMDQAITRDYIVYLTSNHILIGGEIDKMLSILTVTAILTAALARGRRLLVTAVNERAVARDMARFFSPDVARRIRRADRRIHAGQGEAREAAILMVDLRGFTPFAATLMPDQVIGLLADYQARMVPVIQQAGGSIDKFLGDGIMATFGAVEPSATALADGLRAVDAVLAAAGQWHAERTAGGLPVLTVNCALAGGRVVFGAVGHDSRLEYTVVGDAVNLAAKLEKHNRRAGSAALTTAECFAAAVAQGFRPVRQPSILQGAVIEGVDRPMDLAILAALPAPVITEAAAEPA